MGLIIPRKQGHPPGKPSEMRLKALKSAAANPASSPPPIYPPGCLPDHLNPLHTAYLFPGGIPRADLNPPNSLTGRWLPDQLNPLSKVNNPPDIQGAAFALLASAFPPPPKTPVGKCEAKGEVGAQMEGGGKKVVYTPLPPIPALATPKQ